MPAKPEIIREGFIKVFTHVRHAAMLTEDTFTHTARDGHQLNLGSFVLGNDYFITLLCEADKFR